MLSKYPRQSWDPEPTREDYARLLKLQLDEAATCARVFREFKLRPYQELVDEILSCDEIHHHVANEKCNVIATRLVPDFVKSMQAEIDDVRETLAKL